MKTYIYNKVLCTLCSVLLISSCTNDEIITPPAATDDVLATMDANTRVGIKAEMTDNREQSTVTRVEGDETTTTTYYAYREIHADKEVNFWMEVPGASDADKTQLYPMTKEGYVSVPFNTLATTEPFSTLRLKDFNLTEGVDAEGYDRCVSRWTVLDADSDGLDKLWGWAHLTADANGQPVLDYGEMKRASAKVTIVVVDERGAAVDVSEGKVFATLSLPLTLSNVIYTPEEAEQGKLFKDYCSNITTLEADEAIDPDRIGLAVYPLDITEDFGLDGMVTADETGGYYYDKDNNTRSAIVPATTTHTIDDYYNFTPISGGPKFDGTEKLTISVNTDPDGDTGPQTTGTYSLKLSEVKLSDGSALTALKSGEHYILTVTLRHNTLVSATATIGAWSEASANATLGGDNAKLPDNDDEENQ